MKAAILFLLLATGFTADAQTLKDMLYKGKLKQDTTAVIRKTDDLSTKMVDTTAKAADSTKKQDTLISSEAKYAAIDSLVEVVDSMAVAGDDDQEVEIADSVVAEPLVVEAAPVKTNSRIWREYTDSLSTVLKEEVFSNKKIRKGTYYLTVEYEIGLGGEVEVLNVLSSPENETLQNQVKDRLISSPPLLNPVLDSAKQPKKVKRKQNFNVTKD